MSSLMISQLRIFLAEEVKTAKLKLRFIEFFKTYVRKTCTSIFLCIKPEQGIVGKINLAVHKNNGMVAENGKKQAQRI